MSRLIDADEIVYESIDSCDTGRHESYYGTGIVAVRKEDIDAMPTIEERKTGKWVHLGGDEWCCDKCGFVITTEGSWEHPHDIGANYCQNCGASMDGETNDG